MKKLSAIIFLLMTFGSCEKKPEDFLIEGWKDIQRDFKIDFQEGGFLFLARRLQV